MGCLPVQTDLPLTIFNQRSTIFIKMVETCGLTLLDTMNHMYVSAATFNMLFANERCTA
jgi:hypothetical protein